MKPLYPARRPARLRTLCALALAAALLFLLADIPVLAEYVFARGVTRFLSWFIACVTSLLPFSLYEVTAVALILLAIFVAVGLIALLCRRAFARVRTWLYRLAVAALSVLIAFGALYAPLYARASVTGALGLPAVEVTDALAYEAAAYYVDELNALAEVMPRGESGDVIVPYSFDEMADKLNAAYAQVGGGYFAFYSVRPKQVALSVGMAALGITGIYFPFYAEANVSTLVAPYDVGCTLAHELAHAHGVAQEGEANVAAYALCLRSEDPYLRYSGLMRAASAMLNSLDDASFETLYASVSPAVIAEWRNASALYARYDGWLNALSSWINDLFLKANGVPGGVRSYGQTAHSLVALYLQETGQM